jgi:quinol-cytochrome oxidoreductase complex cytochrome b subunit
VSCFCTVGGCVGGEGDSGGDVCGCGGAGGQDSGSIGEFLVMSVTGVHVVGVYFTGVYIASGLLVWSPVAVPAMWVVVSAPEVCCLSRNVVSLWGRTYTGSQTETNRSAAGEDNADVANPPDMLDLIGLDPIFLRAVASPR